MVIGKLGKEAHGHLLLPHKSVELSLRLFQQTRQRLSPGQGAALLGEHRLHGRQESVHLPLCLRRRGGQLPQHQEQPRPGGDLLAAHQLGQPEKLQRRGLPAQPGQVSQQPLKDLSHPPGVRAEHIHMGQGRHLPDGQAQVAAVLQLGSLKQGHTAASLLFSSYDFETARRYVGPFSVILCIRSHPSAFS